MKIFVFASRNRKEILRDPLNLIFGIGFPVILLLLISAIQANAPVKFFEIKQLAPAVAVFGLSFISLFSGILIAKDKTTSFLMRLFASPLSAADFILGYTLPLLPMSIAQCAICFITAFFLGLPININILIALLVLIPIAFLFIGIGLLCGTLLNDKQVGPICGALLTNATAWLSGLSFDLKMIGGWFEKIAYLLPFAHAVDVTRAAVAGNYSVIGARLIWVLAYAFIVFVIAVIVFKKRMRSDNL